MRTQIKEVGVSMLLSDRAVFKGWEFMQDKKGHYITIRGEYSKKTSPSVMCIHLTKEHQNTSGKTWQNCKEKCWLHCWTPPPSSWTDPADGESATTQWAHEHHHSGTEMISITGYTQQRQRAHPQLIGTSPLLWAVLTWGQLSKCGAEGTRELSIPPAQYCCDPKTAPQKYSLFT